MLCKSAGQVLAMILLFNLAYGVLSTVDNDRRLARPLKPRSADNDNEYVWFTRDVHDAVDSSKETEQARPSQQQARFLSKSFRDFLHRKYPTMDD